MEEGITVPSFPANSFQGSRTLSTGPNSKVIAPIPSCARNCDLAKPRLLLNRRIRDDERDSEEEKFPRRKIGRCPVFLGDQLRAQRRGAPIIALINVPKSCLFRSHSM